MKEIILKFIRHGMVASGLGPIVLVVVYLITQHTGNVVTLSVNQVCIGIISLSVLAFIVGGMNVIYQIERLPLMIAILIHGVVLYISYLATYLINGWLETGRVPLLVFTGIFIFGYFAIWAIIYAVIKRRTAKLNEILERNQEHKETAL